MVVEVLAGRVVVAAGRLAVASADVLEEGVMNRSVVDVNGEALVVSQFTLMASTKKGNRPSYIEAAGHEKAIPMYEAFCKALSAAIGKPVGTGEFGADMKVALVNDGPVTICIDTKNKE